MTIQNILDLIQTHNSSIIMFSLIILLSLIEISKIPLNPWKLISKGLKYLAKSIGKVINEDIYTELNTIKNNQEKLDEKINAVDENLKLFEDKTEQDAIKNKRFQILKFYNECYRGIEHNREEFNNIRNTYKDYEDMIREKNLTNGEIDDSYTYIMEKYHECEEKHSFIQ